MQSRPLLLLALSVTIVACSATSSSFLSGRQAFLRGEPDNALGYFEQVAQTEPGYVFNAAPPNKTVWTYIGRAHYNAGRYGEARAALDKALAQLSDDHIARLYRGLTMIRFETAAPASKGFSLQEVTYALREGVAPRRVGTLARERGVSFDLNVETETQLRAAGADSELLGELRKLRAERAKQTKTSAPRREEGAKSISAALTGLRDWLDYTTTRTTQGRFWDPDGDIRAEIVRGLQLVGANPPNWDAIIAASESVGFKLEEEGDRARRDESRETRRPRN
jgi:tetratricopeptide (TPR) repeat protein